MTQRKHWQLWLDEYVAFVHDHGHRPSGSVDDKTEQALHRWMAGQRNHFNSGRLSDERLCHLRKAGFDPAICLDEVAATRCAVDRDPACYAQRNRARWYKNFEEYTRFVRENSCQPKHSAEDEKERSIASWVSNQRSRYRAKRLDTTQEEMLFAAGVDLTSPPRPRNKPQTLRTDNADDAWERNLKACRIIMERGGRIPSHRSENPVERALSGWLRNQRVKGFLGHLPKTRMLQLQKLVTTKALMK